MALALPGVSNFEQKDPVKRKLCHFLGVLLAPSNPSLQKVSMPHAVDSALRGDRGFALQKIICETPEPGPNRPPRPGAAKSLEENGAFKPHPGTIPRSPKQSLWVLPLLPIGVRTLPGLRGDASPCQGKPR